MAHPLLHLTADLVDMASVSFDEGPIADWFEEQLRKIDGLEVVRVGNNIVARTNLGRKFRVALAGHLDTVPANDNATARIDGSVLHGLGSADMKGGLAVMLELARTVRCLLYTSPSPRDGLLSRMPSSA